MAEREYEHEEYDEVDGEYIEDIDDKPIDLSEIPF